PRLGTRRRDAASRRHLFLPRDEHRARNDRAQPRADRGEGGGALVRGPLRAHPRRRAAGRREDAMNGAPVSIARRVMTATAATIAVAALAGAAWYAFGAISAQPIERVTFAGDMNRIAPGDLENFARAVVGGGEGSASLEAIRESARKIPWVRDASVRR